MSKEQNLLQQLLLKIIPDLRVITDLRPNILQNDKTGQNLEIDLYLPDFNIGLEYQGGGHFKEIEWMKNDPDYSRENDFIKQNLMLKRMNRNLVIIEVFYTDLNKNFKDNLLKRIDNTINFLYENTYYSRAYALEKFKLAIKYSLSPSKYIFGKNKITDIYGACQILDLDYTNLNKYWNAKTLKTIYNKRDKKGWYKDLYHRAKQLNSLNEYYILTNDLRASRRYEEWMETKNVI